MGKDKTRFEPIRKPTFRITVKTLRHDNKILTYTNVKSYELDKGMIVFTDSMTNEIKRYAPDNCEITEEAKVVDDAIR